MEQRIFLDFEYIFGLCVVLVLLLIYLFYIKYPYDAERKEDKERLPRATNPKTA